MRNTEPCRKTEAESNPAGIDWAGELARHNRWLRAVVCARLDEPQAIDEVMQEISLAAVRQKAPINDPAKIGPWLYRLAVRQSLLYRRKQGRQRKLVDRYAKRSLPAQFDGHQSDPLAWLLSEERHEQVRRAMARLPKRDAEILLLKYIEDWSYRQIAEHLGVSESAIETRLHRARARLRAEMAKLDLVEV